MADIGWKVDEEDGWSFGGVWDSVTESAGDLMDLATKWTVVNATRKDPTYLERLTNAQNGNGTQPTYSVAQPSTSSSLSTFQWISIGIASIGLLVAMAGFLKKRK